MFGLLCSAAVFVTTLSLAAAGAAGTFRVRDFGAKGDGVTKDTAAVQAAVEFATDDSPDPMPFKHQQKSK